LAWFTVGTKDGLLGWLLVTRRSHVAPASIIGLTAPWVCCVTLLFFQFHERETDFAIFVQSIILEYRLTSVTNYSNSSRKLFLIALLITIAFNGIVLIYFHNRFWWPPDEGVYAHIAERVLKGETLNSDVEEIHTGYLNLLHSAVFGVFGI